MRKENDTPQSDVPKNGEKELHQMVYATVTQQGNELAVSNHAAIVADRHAKWNGGGIRGDVTEFSRQSRMRLISLIARIDQHKAAKPSHRPLFVTLTYPNMMTDGKRAKRDLKTFVERIKRMKDDIAVIWKLEFQQRGAIHFHLMIYNAGFLAVETLQKNWNEVTETESNNSLDLQVIRTYSGSLYYMSKYICKEEDTNHEKKLKEESNADDSAGTENAMGSSMPHIRAPGTVGRYWGVYGRKYLPLAKKRKLTTQFSYYEWLEWVTGLKEAYARCWNSFTVFSDKARVYFWRLEKIVNEKMARHMAAALNRRRIHQQHARIWREQSPLPVTETIWTPYGHYIKMNYGWHEKRPCDGLPWSVFP